MALSGTAAIPHAINNYYDKTMITRAQPLLLHDSFGQVRDIPKNMTETIKFRKYNALSLATTPLTEGVTPAGNSLSVSDVYTTVEQYGDFVIITDKVVTTSPDPVLTEAAQVLGEQAGQTLDVITRDVISAGTVVQYANNAVSRVTVDSADVITQAEIREAVLTLKNANAPRVTKMVNPDTGYDTTPVRPAYVGIIHPNTTDKLRYESGTTWIDVEKYQRSAGALLPGEVGKIGDVRFVETTFAKVFAGAGASSIDVYSTLILGRDAYGITRISGEALRNIVKPLGSAGTADPLDQRTTSGWKAYKTAIILQQLFMVRIEHAV